MKTLIAAPIFMSISALTGCGVIECIDAKFPRTPERLPANKVEITYMDQAPVSVIVSCEKYYDAMCAARGNFWGTREIGTNTPPGLVRFVTLTDPDLGEVKIARPSCEHFKQAKPQEFNPMISINGQTYFYASESDHGHVFVKRDFALQKIPPALSKSVTLRFTISINGKALRPPTPIQS